MINKLELQELIRNMSPLSMSKRFSWNFRRQVLRDMILEDNIDHFEDWAISREFLVVGYTPEIRCKADVVDNYFGDPNLDNQLYHLTRCPVDVRNIETIYEFGSGYGRMHEVCRRLGFTGHYISHDLPELLLIQQYLQPPFGEVTYTSQVIKGSYDLFIANCSLSEIAPHLRNQTHGISMKWCEICYQPMWMGWDNRKYFGVWKHGWDLYWTDTKDPCEPAHRHLIGEPCKVSC